MGIKGLQKTSLVDYPGRVCTSLFWGGCSFRCPWCHNADLVLRPDSLPDLAWPEVLAFLAGRRALTPAVCLTGGEPTLAPELPRVALELKQRGLMVKLDTNGSRPAVLAALIAAGSIDYLAMDVKAPPAKYDRLAGVRVDLGAIEESIALIRGSGLPYEFRTTVVPGWSDLVDLREIGEWLHGARRYALQPFRRANALIEPGGVGEGGFGEGFWDQARAALEPFFGEVVVR